MVDGGNNTEDAATLTGVTTITGTLTINAAGFTSLSLPTLQHVGALVLGDAHDLTSFSMPALTTVDGAITIVDPGALLTTLDFAALTSAQSLQITGTSLSDLTGFDVLTTLTGPLALASTELTSLHGLEGALPTLHGDVSITGNTMLTNASVLDVLTSVSSLTFTGNAVTTLPLTDLTTVTNVVSITSNSALATLSVPVLATAGPITLGQNAITSLSFPALTSGSITVSTDSTITSVSLPVLTTAHTFDFDYCSALATLSAPELTSVSFFYVYGDSNLPECQVDAIYADLSPQPGPPSAHGDNGSGSCN